MQRPAMYFSVGLAVSQSYIGTKFLWRYFSGFCFSPTLNVAATVISHEYRAAVSHFNCIPFLVDLTDNTDSNGEGNF